MDCAKGSNLRPERVGGPLVARAQLVLNRPSFVIGHEVVKGAAREAGRVDHLDDVGSTRPARTLPFDGGPPRIQMGRPPKAL